MENAPAACMTWNVANWAHISMNKSSSGPMLRSCVRTAFADSVLRGPKMHSFSYGHCQCWRM